MEGAPRPGELLAQVVQSLLAQLASDQVDGPAFERGLPLVGLSARGEQGDARIVRDCLEGGLHPHADVN